MFLLVHLVSYMMKCLEFLYLLECYELLLVVYACNRLVVSRHELVLVSHVSTLGILCLSYGISMYLHPAPRCMVIDGVSLMFFFSSSSFHRVQLPNT